MSNTFETHERVDSIIQVRWRPLIKAVIKTGYQFARNMKAFGTHAYAQVNDLVTEARAELDEEERVKSGQIVAGASH